MKKQITRFSPNQNGKVVGIIMGITSTLFAIPMIIIAFLPQILNSESSDIPISIMPMLAIPIMYFVIGYVFTLIACSLYNRLYKHIGGMVYEVEDIETEEEEMLHIPEEDIS